MVAYAQTHSEWGAKDVLAEIVKDYDKDLPSKILLEMAAYIIAEWEKIRASKDYTPEQKAEIGTAIEESYNPKNWIAHEEVLKKYEWLKR